MRLISTLFLCCTAHSLIAQQFDTTVYNNELSVYVTNSSLENLDFTYYLEDTSLDNAHKIHPFRHSSSAWLDQGLIMSPAMALDLDLPNTGIFTQAPQTFSHGLLKSEDIKYYKSGASRTNLKYSQGASDLLYIQTQHSQNIFDRWTAGVNYHRIKTQNQFYDNLPGFNEERMTNVFGFQFFSHYVTLNKNYEVLADYAWNKSTVQETYGITDVDFFDTLSGRQKQYASSAFLPDAENLMSNRTVRVLQLFRPGERKIRVNDTTQIIDTTYGQIKEQWFNEATFRTQANRFIDNAYNENIYPIRYVSATTHDSIFERTFANRFGRIGEISSRLRYKAQLITEWVHLNQLNAHQGNYTNVQLAGNLRRDMLLRGKMILNAEWAVIGYYQGDWNFEGKFIHVVNRDSSALLEASYKSIRHRPDYNMQFFGSNYYYWNRAMDKTNIQQAKTTLRFPRQKTGLELIYRNITGYAYLGVDGLPIQSSNNISYYAVRMKSEVDLGSVFHSSIDLRLQNSNADELRIPDMTAKVSLYLEGHLFKKNMRAQFGVDGYYFSRFKGYQYDPSSRMFKLSNSTTGGYPLIDVFLNMHVQTMKLFVVVEQATQGLFEEDWYTLPGYPMVGTAVRFGAEWRLFN